MRKLLIIIAILISSSVSYGQSYSFSQQNNGSLTVLPVVFMNLTTNGGTPNFDTESEYDNGITNTNYASIWVKANLPWLISVKAQSSTFTPLTTGASSNMPCSVISLKKSTATSYLTLTTSDQTLATGPLGDNLVSGNSFNVSMIFNPGWSYAGGNYRLNVVYTAVQQ
jgi:hypothetical protein